MLGGMFLSVMDAFKHCNPAPRGWTHIQQVLWGVNAEIVKVATIEMASDRAGLKGGG